LDKDNSRNQCQLMLQKCYLELIKWYNEINIKNRNNHSISINNIKLFKEDKLNRCNLGWIKTYFEVIFFGVHCSCLISLNFWPTFLYNNVCLGFQQSASILDDFISTKNDVWGNKRKSRFRLDEPDTREKVKATLM